MLYLASFFGLLSSLVALVSVWARQKLDTVNTSSTHNLFIRTSSGSLCSRMETTRSWMPPSFSIRGGLLVIRGNRLASCLCCCSRLSSRGKLPEECIGHDRDRAAERQVAPSLHRV